MVINDDHLLAAASLMKGKRIELFIMKELFDHQCVDDNFLDIAIKMLSRQKNGTEIGGSLAQEMFAQMQVIAWILAPVKVAYESLPRVTGDQLGQYLANEPATDFDHFFSSFAEYNPNWGEMIRRGLALLEMSSSKIVICRVARQFLEQLPSPLEESS
jgi:hypothetical protein